MFKPNPKDFNALDDEVIFSYRGANPNPEWFSDEPDQYAVECTVKADISMVKPEQSISYTNGRVRVLYQIDFDIVLLFGLTELKAQIAYMENGVEKRGPATVRYDNDSSIVWDQGPMGTMESQKIAIEKTSGELDRLVSEKEDLEGTWSVQETDLENIIRRQGVTIDKRNAEIQDLKAEYKEESNRRMELGIRVQALEKAQREATEGADKERTQLEKLKREFATMQQHAHTTTKLLKTRTEELLTAAQAFLTAADDYSGVDFSQMVVQLNDDIYHAGVLMAEAVIEPDAVEDIPEEGIMETVVKDLSDLGWTEGQIRRLQSDILEQDTILFEAMAQSILVHWCYYIVSSFCYDSRTVDRYFQELWDGIVTSTDAIIAKNWLSLTHSQLKKNRFDENRVMRSLGNVMFAVGWRASTPKKTDVAQQVGEKIGEICAKALKIKEMATQKILSADVRLFSYAPGTPYNPATMEDVYDSGKEAKEANPGQPILCSSGLGNVILKSKVVLASEVEI
ncbi:hypothetical protein EST38_g9765 [Candolleomyces aberdarensis]|uniref:Uncharacterized protein n=1 Tax=Candolleomyces aberdarensis TaxID=2316362 RepID=A0A4Q2D9T6_9AGAR|nr:hypothetical protein EST38_g9765 [Candolleomyces aberdarensis]